MNRAVQVVFHAFRFQPAPAVAARRIDRGRIEIRSDALQPRHAIADVEPLQRGR
jgi:hypothetical protein